jgi:RNA polymerase sigma-70 factor, ECF subfamily
VPHPAPNTQQVTHKRAGPVGTGTPESSVHAADPPTTTQARAPGDVRPAPGRGCQGDADLVHATLAGDPVPAAAIVKRHRPLVRGILRSSLRGPDLEDGIQEVFARCFQCLPRLRDPGSLRSFIIGIALRLAAAERRRRRIHWREHLSVTGDLPEPPAVEDDVEAREVAARTREILGGLLPESHRVLRLRFVHGMELTEVAEMMGVSLATAKRHLARASARFRAIAQGKPVVAQYVRALRLGRPVR